MTEPVPLREHLDARIDWLESKIRVRLDASDKAVSQAATMLDTRLTHSNDLANRTQEWMRETREAMVQRVEHQAAIERIMRMEQELAKGQGRRAGYEPLVAVAMIVVAALVAAVVARFA